MPGAIPQDVVAEETSAAAASVKNRGAAGERLEGDVYYFKLLSSRTCEGTGSVMGVEVEIEAKARLGVSPRDVVLGKGGVVFSASLDLERQLVGCTPLLKISTLNQGERAKGFVLFDLPRKPPEGLTLVYQPTRWGGAGHVSVALNEPLAAP